MTLNTTARPTITLNGNSRRSYNFKIYPWCTSFKSIGAVYVPLRLEGANTYNILYVGQTSDLNQRFDGHHKQGCFDNHRKSHIAVLVVPTEATRLAIETDLVRAYKPVCNG